jgi:hypothetical protein
MILFFRGPVKYPGVRGCPRSSSRRSRGAGLLGRASPLRPSLFFPRTCEISRGPGLPPVQFPPLARGWAARAGLSAPTFPFHQQSARRLRQCRGWAFAACVRTAAGTARTGSRAGPARVERAEPLLSTSATWPRGLSASATRQLVRVPPRLNRLPPGAGAFFLPALRRLRLWPQVHAPAFDPTGSRTKEAGRFWRCRLPCKAEGRAARSAKPSGAA